jgi:hypothetical protein
MPRKAKKVKATSVLPMCATVGFFIGIGLGALLNNVLLLLFVGIAAGSAAGYAIDRRNGISYGRRH